MTVDSEMDLVVGGMTCAGCARNVREALRRVPGVAQAEVSLEKGRAHVRWEVASAPAVETLVQAVTAAGYQASPMTAETKEPSKWSPLAGWRFNVWVGASCTLPLIAGDWIFGWGMAPWFQWLALALALPVQILCGARFYRGAWSQLKAGSSNMDTLVSLGSTTAFSYSLWALLTGVGGHVYFMESAAIITLISVGHWMESLASQRAEGSLRALLRLAPETARRYNLMGKEIEVPVARLRAGDLINLRPGDRVPVDGDLTRGETSVDESMLTGESIPLEKQPGSKLYAGTLNVNGRVLMRVTATGEATALARIIDAVKRAQTSRAHIQRLADQVSNVFVPLAVLAALAAALWWGLAPEQARRVHEFLAGYLWPAHVPDTALAAAFISAAAVLIVACPCAMGLATPIAIMAGTNAAAKRGILIRDGVALERAGKITAVLFDKTGTLTEGKPVVADSHFFCAPTERERFVNLAVALARHSNHPLSQAVAILASGLKAQNMTAWAGASAASVGPGSPSPIPSKPCKGVPSFQETAQEVVLLDWCEIRGGGVQAQMGSTGDPPVPAGDSPAGMRVGVAGSIAGDLRKESLNLPPGQRPGGTGESPVLPNSTARLGSLNWLKESGVDVSAADAIARKWMEEGASILGLAVGPQLSGLFALRDTLKPGAREVVRNLEQHGLRIYLVTGDNERTARAIATQAGIRSENVFAETKPEQKAELVKRLQAGGDKIAFVGDGLNDAPALEQADLGIAVSQACDVAGEAADLVLLRSDIHAIPEAIDLARRALRVIKQNLFWAFFYNAAAIPLAALGFLSPILCAAAMGLSDLMVIGNALRLGTRGRS